MWESRPEGVAKVEGQWGRRQKKGEGVEEGKKKGEWSWGGGGGERGGGGLGGGGKGEGEKDEHTRTYLCLVEV